MLEQKTQTAKEVVGLTVGGATASYGIFNDIVHIAEQIGILAGATLSTLLLIDWIYRKVKGPRR